MGYPTILPLKTAQQPLSKKLKDIMASFLHNMQSAFNLRTQGTKKTTITKVMNWVYLLDPCLFALAPWELLSCFNLLIKHILGAPTGLFHQNSIWFLNSTSWRIFFCESEERWTPSHVFSVQDDGKLIRGDSWKSSRVVSRKNIFQCELYKNYQVLIKLVDSLDWTKWLIYAFVTLEVVWSIQIGIP